MINCAQLCTDDVKTVLQSIASITGKVATVYTQDELLNTISNVSFPACGVVYEGLRAVGEPGMTSKTGNSCELVLSIILVESSSKIVKLGIKPQVTSILDEIRNLMIDRTSPTRHKWKFIVEAAASPVNGTIVWVQRWSTPVQLISSRP